MLYRTACLWTGMRHLVAVPARLELRRNPLPCVNTQPVALNLVTRMYGGVGNRDNFIGKRRSVVLVLGGGIYAALAFHSSLDASR